MRHSVVLVVLGVLGLGLVACGDDESPTPRTAAEVRELTVMMRDIAFEPEFIEVPRGETVWLNFENNGALQHDFSVDARPMDRMDDRRHER